jgi:hypothetical protein
MLIQNVKAWILEKSAPLLSVLSDILCSGHKKESVSFISGSAESVSVDDRLVALWTGDPTYTEYLLATFEIVRN